MATQAVIDTTELFEMVLLAMDNKTLLQSQATNQRFAAVIQNRIIQEKLFFFSPNARVPGPMALARGVNSAVNPLFSEYEYGHLKPGTFKEFPDCRGIRFSYNPPSYDGKARAFRVDVEFTVDKKAKKPPQGQVWRKMRLVKPGYRIAVYHWHQEETKEWLAAEITLGEIVDRVWENRGQFRDSAEDTMWRR